MYVQCEMKVDVTSRSKSFMLADMCKQMFHQVSRTGGHGNGKHIQETCGDPPKKILGNVMGNMGVIPDIGNPVQNPKK
jgi:hypothetical protein